MLQVPLTKIILKVSPLGSLMNEQSRYEASILNLDHIQLVKLIVNVIRGRPTMGRIFLGTHPDTLLG